MDKERNWKIAKVILRIVLLVFAAKILFFSWAFIWMIIVFGSVHRAAYLTCWTAFMLSLAICVLGVIFNRRKLRRISYVVMPIALAVWCAAGIYYWLQVERYPVITQQVNWWQYDPDNPESKLIDVTAPAEYLIDRDAGYPRLNGAYALYPIYAAMAKALYPSANRQYRKILATAGSDVIYDELLKGERDLIFALAPSQKQQDEAAEAGITYDMVPFCKDAFVFYVNVKNPVDNLTTEQIKGIYSGRITNWREVGSSADTKIIPFQRNEGSGSQTALQKLMGALPIMPPLKEDRLGGMGDIINDIANYRNYNAAIGFSFRYYATELLRNNQIKLLAIDGVKPTVENIRNGTYPLTTTAYMVTARPRTANTQKIIDFLTSPVGQQLVEETGYVPYAQ